MLDAFEPDADGCEVAAPAVGVARSLVLWVGGPGAGVPGVDEHPAPSTSTVSSVAVRRITYRHPSQARKFNPNLSIKSHHD